MRASRITSLAFLVALTMVPDTSWGDESIPGIELTPVQITAYKSGLSWVVSEGRGEPNGRGDILLNDALHALYGSLHLATRDDVEIRSAVSTEVSYRRPARDLGELIEASRGRKVQLRTAHGSINGLLQSIIDMPGGARGLLVATAEGRSLVPLTAVRALEISGADDGVAEERRTIKISLVNPGDKVHLVAEYLTDRFAWLPEYRIDTSNTGHAALHLDAYVINDLADLSGAEVFLATGVARFQSGAISNPLESDEPMDELLWKVANQGSGGERRGRQGILRSDATGGLPVAASGGEAFGVSHEDTFLYGPLDLNLDRGQRGRYPVLRREVPYEDLFYWEVSEEIIDPDNPPPVWLAVQLRNTTPGPLTMGPVTVVEGDKPVGQGTISYTGAGEEAVIKVSRSTRVLGSVRENEVSRQTRAEKVSGLRVDRLILDGELVLRNTSTRGAKIRVVRRLVGRLDKEAEGAEVQEAMLQPGAINTTTTLTWDLELPPAGERSLTYRYRVLQYAD